LERDEYRLRVWQIKLDRVCSPSGYAAAKKVAILSPVCPALSLSCLRPCGCFLLNGGKLGLCAIRLYSESVRDCWPAKLARSIIPLRIASVNHLTVFEHGDHAYPSADVSCYRQPEPAEVRPNTNSPCQHSRENLA
jgi:hypothetical protein